VPDGIAETSKRRNHETTKPLAGQEGRPRLRWLFAAVVLLAGGCQEFVHMGQVSDQLSASSVNAVTIEQQQVDGSWKYLGETDGNGRWWIMKNEIKAGRRIRLTKPGYQPKLMSDTDFLQQHNLTMLPEESPF